MKTNNYKNDLKNKMDKFTHFVYKFTKKYPKEELYGVVSQLRRAALSVVLNYIEGYARRRPAVQLNFFEISYGSLKEAKYLLNFSREEEYLDAENYDISIKLADEIGAMLWTELESLRNSLEH